MNRTIGVPAGDHAELDAWSLEVAIRLAEGAQSAIRWKKYAPRFVPESGA